MIKKMSALNIPKTDSIKKLAHFWDTHDLTDFEDQLEEVNESVFEREIVMNIHLQRDEADVIKKIANSNGISYINLLQGWIRERIHAK